MEKKFTTKEVVIVAMVAAVIGVIYTLLDWAYMPLSAVLGTVFMELTFGVYMLSIDIRIGCASRIRHLWRAGDSWCEPAAGKPLWSAAGAGRIPGGTCG